MKEGDFSNLGESYRKFRVGYAEEVLKMLVSHTGIGRKSDAVFVDVGAGTGIWTRQVMDACKNAKCIAIEPSEDMRRNGKIWTEGLNVEWRPGTGEETGLPDACADWVSMASSFHWTDRARSLPEFRRILKKGGHVTLIWNPLMREGDPIQEKVEGLIHEIVPEFTRGSRASEDFGKVLAGSGLFTDVIEIRMVKKVRREVDEYIEAWKAVNHLQAVAGPERFQKFLQAVKELLKGQSHVDVPYLTKAWTARRVD